MYWQSREPDYPKCWGVARRPPLVDDVGSEHEIADVDEPKDQGGGESGVPTPPSAPDGSRPDRAGEQHQGRKNDAHLSRCVTKQVPALCTFPQEKQAANEDDQKGQIGSPGEWQ